MNKLRKFPRLHAKRRKVGVAIVVVLTAISLSMILLLALLSTSQAELSSSSAASEGTTARLEADSAVSLVIGQIQSATHQDDAKAGMETWTSQPGMVRQYRENGILLKGHKLYSDRKMVATTDKEIIADTPPADWSNRTAQYVDMNEPVARRSSDQPEAPVRWFFPIIDPRAYSNDPDKSVEGFSYSNYVNGTNGAELDGVELPGGGAPDAQRLPMPVEWLYFLKDGTIGFLDDDNRFIGPDGVKPSKDNPIVSRVAFWTDDESCKININTAAEGTYWDIPRLYHERDGDWARYQPMTYEYQRYPGHPATVCLSTVLFPNQEMNPLKSEVGQFEKALTFKEKIYDLIPKILPGGSKAGSVLVPAGRNFTPTAFKEVQNALNERLFASVDEFLLRPKVDGSGERQEIDLNNAGAWSGLSRAEMLERLRPFLTPRSRSPELNPFGLPKISMWPEHRNTGGDYRTVFDRTIAYCSTLAGKEYYFTRQDCTSQTELNIPRNAQLFNYLMNLTSRPIPGFGTTAAATFANKYGDNRQQILVEIFDYIRSTNLYDENIAEKSVGETPAIPGLPTSRLTSSSAAGGMASKTFTPMRNANGSSYAGHGQVMPTVMPRGKNEVYRGMGRFLTISEAGLQFIATARGTEQAGGMSAEKIVPTVPPAEVGYTPPTWRGGAWGNTDRWYSNFPPLTGDNQDPKNGFYKTKYPTSNELEGHAGGDKDHPGYNPMNWNWTLDKDTPLENGKERVQATFLLEWFCPASGWTLINPDLQIEVDASELTVDGKKMFPVNGGKTVVRPYQHMSSGWGIYQRGGTISYRAFLQNRKLPAVATGVNGNQHGSMLEDTSYRAYSSRTDILQDCNQYNLVSDFFDVDADGTINFSGGTVIVRIRSNKTSSQILQTFNFKFKAASFPAPILATKNEDTKWSQNFDGTWTVKQPVPAPYWWSFHADGALGRNIDGTISTAAADPLTRMGGRFRFIGNEIGSYGNEPSSGTYNRGNLVIPDDTLQSLVLRHGDPRLTMGQYLVPQEEFEPHRLYGKQRLAHNIVLAHWSEGPGLDRGEDKKGWRLVKDANYSASFLPDHPYSAATGAGLQKYGDFDRGISNQTDGAYINKPDEGNTYGVISSSTGEQAVPYFTDPWVTWLGGSAYFSPNRQVASPGMFGSLPTGVHQSGVSPPGKKREPWRTLLFRPQTWSRKRGQQPHIGAPKSLKGYGPGTVGLGVQGYDPPDYLFMDFFWMPVVEPYAISAPASTAGKINMNYQMEPFRHIRRATGLRAVMKSEIITAVAHADANTYLKRPGSAPPGAAQTWFWKDDGSGAGRKFWHRNVDLDATLKLFDERFSSGFAFISPAQICEMYLLPKRVNATDTLVPAKWADNIKSLLKEGGSDSILKFWEDHAITGENLKERPYTNIYPRLTTRSNTYQVYMRAQVIKKVRSTDPEVFDPIKDRVSAEYRGSAVIERYLDLGAPEFQPGKGTDYATGNLMAKRPLDESYRFRVISQKRFDP